MFHAGLALYPGVHLPSIGLEQWRSETWFLHHLNLSSASYCVPTLYEWMHLHDKQCGFYLLLLLTPLPQSEFFLPQEIHFERKEKALLSTL